MLMLHRDAILRGLRMIDVLAKEAGVVVDQSIYGGAALALAFDIRRTAVMSMLSCTEHLIACGVPLRKFRSLRGGRGIGSMTASRGLHPAMKKRFYGKSRCFGDQQAAGLHPGSRIPFFAMKCMAMRPEGIDGSHDISDIEALADAAAIEGAQAAFLLVEAFCPAARIPPNVRFAIEEIMGRMVARRAAHVGEQHLGEQAQNREPDRDHGVEPK